MSEPARESEVIHRLKNHLCIVVGFCELVLEDCALDDPRRRDLLEVHKAAQDAVAMMPEVSRHMRGDLPRKDDDDAASA